MIGYLQRLFGMTGKRVGRQRREEGKKILTKNAPRDSVRHILMYEDF